jgi:hypothetical protein
MYKTILVNELINEGAALVNALRRGRVPLLAALWSYFPEPREWRLVIVSSIVDSRGPLEGYRRIQQVLAAIHPTQLSLSDITLISPHSSDYNDLRDLLSRPGRFGTAPAPESAHSVIFEDTYVYPVDSARH